LKKPFHDSIIHFPNLQKAVITSAL